MAMMAATATTVAQIPCDRCGGTVGEWSSRLQAIIIRRPPKVPYLLIPGRQMTIQCHHNISVHGHFEVCGKMNDVNLDNG